MLLAIDQLRQDSHHFIQQIHHFVGWTDGLINDPVEHVFDGPGQFPDRLCTDQSTTTLEGMEGTPETGQGIFIIAVALPDRQRLPYRIQLFPGLLDKYLEDFGINVLKGRLVPGGDGDLFLHHRLFQRLSLRRQTAHVSLGVLDH